MPDLKNIRKALGQPLQDGLAAQTPPILIAWPNTFFDTNQKNPQTKLPTREYVRFSFKAAPDDPRTLGQTPQYESLGIISCDVFVQSGANMDRADDIVNIIKGLYPYASNLVRNGVSVLILETTTGAGVDFDSWYYISLNIKWASWS